MTAAIGVYKVF